jgi:hypothetical protein
MVHAMLDCQYYPKRTKEKHTPISWKTEGSPENTGSEERASSPAHGYPRGQVSSHGHGTDLGGVGGGESLEDTPWETTNHVSDKQHWEGGGENEDEY